MNPYKRVLSKITVDNLIKNKLFNYKILRKLKVRLFKTMNAKNHGNGCMGNAHILNIQFNINFHGVWLK